MGEMGFTCDRVTSIGASIQSCLPCIPLAGRAEPPEASWMGLKMKATRVPDQPQDTTVAYRFRRGKWPHQPADSWPFGKS